MIKTNPTDFKMNDEKLIGIYRGVIEDVEDPLKAGRCRVRVLGVHTHIKDELPIHGVPIEHLTWAEPVLNICEGGVSWYGQWHIPLKGSWVYVFFENGNIMAPRFFGSAPAIPLEGPQGVGGTPEGGFWDPDEIYPENPCPHPGPSSGISKLMEPDLPRFCREDESETYIPWVDERRKLGIEIAECYGGGGAWDEFEPFWKWGSKYPHNSAFMFHGQMSMEFDSTPDSSRFSIVMWEPASRFEMYKDGTMIIKNKGGDRHDICHEGNRKQWTEMEFHDTVELTKNVKCGLVHRTQAGIAIYECAEIEIRERAGIRITEEAGTYISEEAGVYISSTAGVYRSEEAGVYISEKAGVFISEEAGVYISEYAEYFITEYAGDYITETAGSYIYVNAPDIKHTGSTYYDTASSYYTVESPIITLDGNVHITGNLEIDGIITVDGAGSGASMTIIGDINQTGSHTLSGTLDAATVLGLNVTSGNNPGHTHS